MQNPYKTLGVSKDASHKDIKTAFFKLAKEHHPDKGGNPEEFKRINEAYDILKDPQKRQQFDLGGFNQQNPGNNSFSFSFGEGFEGFDDVIKDFFGAGPMRGFGNVHRTPLRNRDVKITVQSTLEDIYFQTQKEFNIQTPNGQSKNVKLTIPVDADSGTVIKFKGLGDTSYGELRPGDLLVNIKIKDHQTYTRNDFDLFQNYKINIFDIITGCDLEIDHISGTKIKTSIKEGSQPTQTMRFKGKGMPKRNGTYGDLYIQIKPYTPPNLNKKIIKYIRENKDD